VSLLSPSLIACANLAIAFSSRPAASIPPVIKKHTLPSNLISWPILLGL
jgi:hypothetical protein